MRANNFARPSNIKNYEEEVKTCPECGAEHADWEFDLKDINYCVECEADLTEVETETEYITPDDFEYEDL